MIICIFQYAALLGKLEILISLFFSGPKKLWQFYCEKSFLLKN